MIRKKMRARIPLSIESKKILKLLMYTLSGLLLTTSVYFFAKTSTAGERGYLLEEYRSRLNTLESDNRILKQQLLDAQALSALEESDVVLGLTPPAQPIYVEAKGPLTKRR